MPDDKEDLQLSRRSSMPARAVVVVPGPDPERDARVAARRRADAARAGRALDRLLAGGFER